MSQIMIDKREQHKQQMAELSRLLDGNTQSLSIVKKSISNLFGYEASSKDSGKRKVDLSRFNKPLYINAKDKTLEVQGLTTMNDIVDFCLPHGLLPLITPELKHITIGGAIVGIGIESNCYKYGFVHDSLIETDVLLPNGTIVTVTANNKYSDLFYGLPNSYGTLGYVLRAKIKLRPVTKYVQLATQKYNDSKSLLVAIKQSTQDTTIDYVESLVYDAKTMYLTTGKQVKSLPNGTKLSSIYGHSKFYKDISKAGDIYLPTKEYIFRYDPEWFWNVPESRFYDFYRRVAPPAFRNSGFFTRYNAFRSRHSSEVENDNNLEKLIQDWEVPWEQAQKLLDFGLNNIDMAGHPWLITVIKTPAKATCYPMQANKLYLNLGSYSFAKKQKSKEPYYNTKIMDNYCFAHQGIKMLYSSTFISRSKFDKIYAGEKYKKLKQKYDSDKLAPTTYEKIKRA